MEGPVLRVKVKGGLCQEGTRRWQEVRYAFPAERALHVSIGPRVLARNALGGFSGPLGILGTLRDVLGIPAVFRIYWKSGMLHVCDS